MNFRHIASLYRETVHFPLLLKEGWSDFTNLFLEMNPPGQTGVVDSTTPARQGNFPHKPIN